MPERNAHREHSSDAENRHQTGNNGCLDEPEGPFDLRNYRRSNLAQQRGDTYHGGTDGVEVLTYDDLNHAGYKDIPQHVCDEMILIHDHLMDNWFSKSTSTTSFSVLKLGPNIKVLQKRDIITPMEDTTPKAMFDFYTMLQNQLPSHNVLVTPLHAIIAPWYRWSLSPWHWH